MSIKVINNTVLKWSNLVTELTTDNLFYDIGLQNIAYLKMLKIRDNSQLKCAVKSPKT